MLNVIKKKKLILTSFSPKTLCEAEFVPYRGVGNGLARSNISLWSGSLFNLFFQMTTKLNADRKVHVFKGILKYIDIFETKSKIKIKKISRIKKYIFYVDGDNLCYTLRPTLMPTS